MNTENKLSICNTYIEEATMEIDDTCLRDKLIDAQNQIKKVIWHLKRDKVK
jgi:hypothetical protein